MEQIFKLERQVIPTRIVGISMIATLIPIWNTKSYTK